MKVDVKGVAHKLSLAIQTQTISYMKREEIDYTQFENLHKILETHFPLVHEQLDKELINGYSLLFKWQGSHNDALPILYMAHQDVVPISKGTEKDWEQEPFSGAIVDGYVWGRGALDTKVTMIGVLEAVELLLEEGFKPKKDLYLAFGHDEEIQGDDGAKAIADYLMDRKVRLGAVLDEGGLVNLGSIDGVKTPIGLVGIAEKGYMDVRVTVQGKGGHASTPPKSTALGQISELVRRLESHQMPMFLSDTTKIFLGKIGPEMSGVNRLIVQNLWLFKPLFMAVFSKSNSGNALLRTTTAATMCEASNASNVLPQSASATFNFRIAPWDSKDQVINHIKEVAKNIEFDYDILQSKEPSKVSSIHTKFFKHMAATIEGLYEDVVVAPYTVLAATDSVKYEAICDDIYRFAPLLVSKEELASIHGTNEKVSLENLDKCVRFFIEMIRDL